MGTDSSDGGDTPRFYDTREERCPECGQQRPHHVMIEVRTESENYGGNQPYRIAECQVCGHTREERVGLGE